MEISLEQLKWYGRTLDIDGCRYFDYSASGFEFCFTGKKASCTIYSDSPYYDENTKAVVGLYVTELSSPADYKGQSYWENFPSELTKRFILTEEKNNITLFESSEEKTVLIRVLKLSEVNFGSAGIKNIEIEGKLNIPQGGYLNQNDTKALKVEIIGDSITCGYGIEGIFNKDGFTTKQERADLAYGFLTMKELGAEFQECCWSGIGIISKYVDASIEIPDTSVVMPSVWPYTDKSLSLRKGLEPQIWDEKRFSPDLVIVHLGTNDASYVRKVEGRRQAYISGLQQFLEAIHRRSPSAKLLCCLGVMGQDLCTAQEEAVKLFSKDFKTVPVKVVKFPVHDENVDGVAADWHPNKASHLKISKILAKAIKEW
ncbi:MAG: hypothetical protein K6D95_11290 [Treponema sp.]|nr:hypothetical protein [Treponema sp.]